MNRIRRVVLVGNTAHSMIHFRRTLITRLLDDGHEVHVIVPRGPEVEGLEALGARVSIWRISRRSTNPFRELMSLVHLAIVHRRIRPDLAHYFSLKPALYGPLAARTARVPHTVSSITGLGYVFTGGEPRARYLRRLVVPLCRVSFALANEVLFQNEEDKEVMRSAGALPVGRGTVLLGGEGVDCAVFDPARVEPSRLDALRDEIKIGPDEKVVLLVARILGHKGVREYVEAARNLRGRAKFLLVGPIDPENPSWISPEEVAQWQSEGVILHLGERSDIRELLALSDIAVLPSYREGTSQFLLEATSMGRASIAADVPGCRVVVEHGRTGFLVPPRDSVGLTEALDELLTNDARRQEMGRAARARAVSLFDVHRVVDRLIATYSALGDEGDGDAEPGGRR